MNIPPSAPSRAPFRSLSAQQWRNLLIVGLAVFWLAQVASDIARGNVFGRFASDVGTFWSAGYIANQYGYASVYDLGLMARVQQALLPHSADSSAPFNPIPTPYVPIFIVPFQLLALLRPYPAAMLWILLNSIGTIVYVRALLHRIPGSFPTRPTLALLLVSAPVFINLFTGQVNLFLMIGVGEFVSEASRARPLRAGLWLGLLLIKPQFLILVVPAMLLQREIRTILGLVLATAFVAVGSFLLAGSAAFTGPAALWLGYAAGSGLPSNDIPLMMNWRMLAMLLIGLVSPTAAWIAAGAGLIATVVTALASWTRPLKPGTLRQTAALLGLFAATCLVAWHSHVHAAMILIPLVLTLRAQHGPAVERLLETWVLLPAALYVLRLLLAALLVTAAIRSGPRGLVDHLAGIGLFGMNLVLLVWATRVSRAAAPSLG